MKTALVTLVLVATAATTQARPLRSGHDRVGSLPDGGLVVLTDLCSEAPSCEPNRLQVFAGGLLITDLYRGGLPGEPLAPKVRRRMIRLYDAAIAALGATAVAPEPAATDAMGLTRFTRLHWTHDVDRDASGVGHAHVRRADGTEIVTFQVASWYDLEALVRVGETCVLISYTNYPSDLSGQDVQVFACPDAP